MTSLPSSARAGRRGTVIDGPAGKGKSRLTGENIKEKQVLDRVKLVLLCTICRL